MKKLLITGEMRSGTTFCANFLNSQKNISLYADTLVSLFMEGHKLGVSNIKTPLSEREKNVLLSNLRQEGVRNGLDLNFNRSEDHSWLNLWEKSTSSLPQTQDTKILGVKRTRELDYLEQLLDNDTLIIYMMRDPRDVLLSAKNRFSGFNLFKAIANWKESYTTANKYSDRTGFMMLKFEELILDKEKIAKRLEVFLGVSVNIDLQNLTDKDNRSYTDNSSFGDVNKLFDANAISRWKKNTIGPEVQLISELLHEEIKDLGYDTSVELTNEGRALVKKHSSWVRKSKIKNTLKSLASKFLD